MRPKIIRTCDWLDGKWHHERHDLPKPYEDVVLALVDGRYVDGYCIENGEFCPWRSLDVAGYERLVIKGWRYGMIAIESNEK